LLESMREEPSKKGKPQRGRGALDLGQALRAM
jgi:hypothetical protein